MKVYRYLIITAFLLAASLVVIIGCKYDVAEPSWNKPTALGTEVTITSIDPPQEAAPGVNIITIHGSGFKGALDSMKVHIASTNKDTTIVYQGIYFGNVPADVVSISSTSITMRRPDIVSDSCIIKVLSDKALVNAKIGPYKIDAVKSQSGAFLDNVVLGTVSIDNLGNLYVINGTAPYTIYKVTPAGDKTVIGTAFYGPTDAKIGRDGNLYYLNSQFQKRIYVVDLHTSTPKRDSIIAPISIKFGDFDDNGYFYAGGNPGSTQSGIVVVRPDRSSRLDNFYATDTVTSVRVFNKYLYVAARGTIWRHSISDTSIVGTQELVLDLTQGPFGYVPIRAFSFSADGSKMYIGANSPNPLLVADLITGNVEIMYKGLLPSYCKQLCFGNGNKLYMISGNVAPPVNWTLYQVDVGTTGAPYY